MSIEENVQVVKDFFAAIGNGDKQRVLALVAEDIEWIVPGKDWPLAGTHRAHAGVEEVLQKASKEIEMTYPEPPEFVAQGERVKESGFLSSVSLQGKSKQRISHLKIPLSSTSPFAIAN